MSYLVVIPKTSKVWLLLSLASWSNLLEKREEVANFGLHALAQPSCFVDHQEINLPRKGLSLAWHVSPSNLIWQAKGDCSGFQLSV